MSDELAQVTIGRKPWERMPTETDIPWQAFQQYLALPKRGDKNPRRYFDDICAIRNVTKGTVSKWAVRFRWEERAAAYDLSVNPPVAIAEIEVRREDAKYRRQLGDECLYKARQALLRGRSEPFSQ